MDPKQLFPSLHPANMQAPYQLTQDQLSLSCNEVTSVEVSDLPNGKGQMVRSIPERSLKATNGKPIMDPFL